MAEGDKTAVFCGSCEIWDAIMCCKSRDMLKPRSASLFALTTLVYFPGSIHSKNINTHTRIWIPRRIRAESRRVDHSLSLPLP